MLTPANPTTPKPMISAASPNIALQMVATVATAAGTSAFSKA